MKIVSEFLRQELMGNEKQKKALIVTALGGFVRSFLNNDIKLLQEKGYEVHCAANINHPGAENLKDYFDEMKVIFHQIDFSSNKIFNANTFKSYNQIKRLINGINFDLIHCHTPIAGALTRMAAKKRRKKGCIVIYTTHGFYFHKHSSKKTWTIFFNMEKYLSRFCDAIITINHEDFENAKKMHCKKVFYIPGVGVDTNKLMNICIDRQEYRKKLGVNEDQILILAVGELSQRKNHKVILEALSLIKNPKIVFMICGNAMNSFNTKDELEKLAKEYNIDLRLMGLRKDIPEICKCADIGVLPSTREGLGLSGIEMLASGLPIVASNVHGIVDYVIDSVDGYLCDSYNPNQFSKCILKLTDKNIKKTMSSNCQIIAKKFDIAESKKELNKIYDDLIY